MKIMSTILSLIFSFAAAEGLDNFALINLDTYLKMNNVFISEGYITGTQKTGLIQDIQRARETSKILEIGFNAGHSAEFFLTHTDCKKLVSFDIGTHDYLQFGLEYMQRKYGDRFSLITGDSKITVPEYAAAHPDEKFDLIFIDGGHNYDCIFADLLNCRQLAYKDTLIIIDDYVGDVKTVVDIWIQSGQLILLDCNSADENYIPGRNGGWRIWVVAKYAYFYD
jgi:predicted O-methyltransferase YrrM